MNNIQDDIAKPSPEQLKPSFNQLKRTMQETMGRCVARRYTRLNNDSKQLNDAFKKQILRSPFNTELLNALQLDALSLDGKEISFLHTLYNNPDSLGVTGINQDAVALKNFQQLMLESYKMARLTCESVLAQEKREGKRKEKEEKAIDLNKFDPSPKNSTSDEVLAKLLQAEFDREDEINGVQFLKITVSAPGQQAALQQQGLRTTFVGDRFSQPIQNVLSANSVSKFRGRETVRFWVFNRLTEWYAAGGSPDNRLWMEIGIKAHKRAQMLGVQGLELRFPKEDFDLGGHLDLKCLDYESFLTHLGTVAKYTFGNLLDDMDELGLAAYVDNVLALGENSD